MQISYPIPLTEHLMGTLTIKIKVGRETMAQAMRMDVSPEELENIAVTKLQDIGQVVSELLKTDESGW